MTFHDDQVSSYIKINCDTVKFAFRSFLVTSKNPILASGGTNRDVDRSRRDEMCAI